MRLGGIEHNTNRDRCVTGITAVYSKAQKVYVAKQRKESKNFDFRKELVERTLKQRKQFILLALYNELPLNEPFLRGIN